MNSSFHVWALASCLVFISVFSSCKSGSDYFEVKDFVALSNFQSTSDTLKKIELDYTDAIKEGFIIPTIRQVREGEFEFSFQIKNKSSTDQKFYYKFYYQNETYKFSENSVNSSENFYGSWEDVNRKFMLTDVVPSDGQFHKVSSKFRIVGNPRDEKQFYGSDKIGPVTREEIESMCNAIKSTPAWFQSVVDKAKVNGLSLEKQLQYDAIYSVNVNRNSGGTNNRWKRNPRVGLYSFMLVVTHQSNIYMKKIPEFIQNISLTNNGAYYNPYTFFLEGEGPKIEDNTILFSKDKLKVIAHPQLGNGIFINKSSFGNANINTTAYGSRCNETNKMFYEANFEQFIHSYNPFFTFENIPKVANVSGGEYTKLDYSKNTFLKTQAIKRPIEITNCPCKTVQSDSINKKIILTVPATREGEWRKENVGIITRNGLSYGKYMVKAKLPELLNKDNLWNGLTNAVWMIYQQGEWNKRRVCSKNGGYVPKNFSGHDDKDKPKNSPQDVYSEIDIEIVKASRNWPLSSYGGDKSKKPADPVSDSDKVMVTYTNWDLACQDPKKFSRGVFNIEHNNITSQLHRWDYWYQAVTGKYPAFDDELFKAPYFWFEIEWTPKEIIWRIGPEKTKMREIGYVNEDVSSIPNNQMLLVITQEWHLANWWPEAPFDQNRIPFPQKNIVGEVLDIEIE